MTTKRATPGATPEEDVQTVRVEAGGEVPAETTTPTKGSVVVKFRGENGFDTERTFSKDVHGADFANLAKEFTANMQAQGRLNA